MKYTYSLFLLLASIQFVVAQDNEHTKLLKNQVYLEDSLAKIQLQVNQLEKDVPKAQQELYSELNISSRDVRLYPDTISKLFAKFEKAMVRSDLAFPTQEDIENIKIKSLKIKKEIDLYYGIHRKELADLEKRQIAISSTYDSILKANELLTNKILKTKEEIVNQLPLSNPVDLVSSNQLLLIVYDEPIANVNKFLNSGFDKQDLIKQEIAKIPDGFFLNDKIFDPLRNKCRYYDTAVSFLANSNSFLINPNPFYTVEKVTAIIQQYYNLVRKVFKDEMISILDDKYFAISEFCKKNNQLLDYINQNKSTFTAAKKAMHYNYIKEYEEGGYVFLVNSFKEFYEACLADPNKKISDCKIKNITPCK